MNYLVAYAVEPHFGRAAFTARRECMTGCEILRLLLNAAKRSNVSVSSFYIYKLELGTWRQCRTIAISSLQKLYKQGSGNFS